MLHYRMKVVHRDIKMATGLHNDKKPKLKRMGDKALKANRI